MAWQLITTCINARGEDIDEMNRAARDITYDTMRRIVGDAFINAQRELNYDVPGTRGRGRIGLTMRSDWAVSYHRSTYQGRPCLFFRWSHIEHIFQET